MSTVSFNLLVLRTADLERAAAFYSCLGLQFVSHRHESGPRHLTAEVGGVIFELYPLSPKSPATSSTRLGFRVASLSAVLLALDGFMSAMISPPADSAFGRRAVVADPDGHRVELLEA